MKNTSIAVGSVIGFLRVAEFIGSDGHSKWWRCICECGAERKIRTAQISTGKTKSCGCKNAAVWADSGKERKTHGMSQTRVYNVWHSMRNRCQDPKANNWERYGGRGITVCEEWNSSFEIFYAWASKNGYRDDLQIDRKDNNGPYAPWNCKFSTPKEQAANRRVRRDSPRWGQYADAKARWIAANPGATAREYEGAMVRLARLCGV